ncbi:MFS transporter [Oricola sp.]|uniref:MFS transporter n=1 Tax=Oricola sp. TaxID=1979950 RepID=UPI0025E11DFC|nr:MFS transporter [Oricola sp.]MCI5073684.1 MFS transporter [Oricola sp.]
MDPRLIWLAVGAFATSTVAFVFAGLLPLIADSVGVSVSQAGLLMTAFSLSYAIGTPVLATVTGTIDRRRVIGMALIAFMVANLAAASAGSYTMLMLAQIVMGAFTGLFASTAQATAVALSDPQRRARAVSIVIAGTTFAVAFGAPLGALIGNLVGWRFTFLFVAALAMTCLVILWFRLPHDIAGMRLSLGERVLAIGHPGVLPALAVSWLYVSANFTLIAYMAPLAMEGAGMSRDTVPLLLLVFGVGAVTGNALAGWLGDRLGATRTVVIAILGALTLATAIALTLGLLPSRMAAIMLTILMFPWGLVGWSFPSAQTSRLVAAAPQLLHLTMPLHASVIYLGIASGGLIGAQLLAVAEAKWLPVVSVCVLLVTLATLAADVLRRRSHPA